MAGFFGLFNYEKEGPGIEKNAPKKKTFFVFFETFFRNFWKFVPINAVFCALSLPVITGGLTSVGMTNVTRNIARDKHSFGLSDFFETIRKNWKQALPEGIINTLVFIVSIFAARYYWAVSVSQGSKKFFSFGSIGMGIILGIIFVFCVMRFYMYTLTITFGFKLGQVYRNSFRFVFLNFWRNLLCCLVLLVTYAFNIALFVLPFLKSSLVFISALAFIMFVCCFPAFRFLLIQYFTFPAIRKFIIDPYYEKHPDDDIELRKNLGVYDEEEEDDEEEEEDWEDDDESDDEDDDAFPETNRDSD